MIIAGTGGLGKEVAAMLIKEKQTDDFVFFDENEKAADLIFNKYPVIKKYQQLEKYFRDHDNKFIVAIGHPRTREKVYNKILAIGGEPTNVISTFSHIFPYIKDLKGCIIQPGVGISHGTEIGASCAIHINSSIGHNVKIGNFVNIAPSATIIGPCFIGDYSYISAQAVIMPGVNIGKNCIINVGSIVKKDLPDFSDF